MDGSAFKKLNVSTQLRRGTPRDNLRASQIPPKWDLDAVQQSGDMLPSPSVALRTSPEWDLDAGRARVYSDVGCQCQLDPVAFDDSDLVAGLDAKVDLILQGHTVIVNREIQLAQEIVSPWSDFDSQTGLHA